MNRHEGSEMLQIRRQSTLCEVGVPTAAPDLPETFHVFSLLKYSVFASSFHSVQQVRCCQMRLRVCGLNHWGSLNAILLAGKMKKLARSEAVPVWDSCHHGCAPIPKQYFRG